MSAWAIKTNSPIFIQWKGTDVCLDFNCPCGESNHIDAEFAYYIQCQGCFKIFELSTSVDIRELPQEEIPPIDPVREDGWIDEETMRKIRE